MDLERFAKTALADLLGDQPDEIVFECTPSQFLTRAWIKGTCYPVVPVDLPFMQSHFDWSEDPLNVLQRQLQTHYRNRTRDGTQKLAWQRTGNLLRLTWRKLGTEAVEVGA